MMFLKQNLKIKTVVKRVLIKKAPEGAIIKGVFKGGNNLDIYLTHRYLKSHNKKIKTMRLRNQNAKNGKI